MTIKAHDEQSTLSLPNGQAAGNIDRIMLLNIWGNELSLKHGQTIFKAAYGQPTAGIPFEAGKVGKEYWNDILDQINGDFLPPQITRHISVSSDNERLTGPSLVEDSAVIENNDSLVARKIMANALNRLYRTENHMKINTKHLLFVPGGAGGLYNIFEVLKKLNPNSNVLSPLPYYPLYTGQDNSNNLLPIEVMNRPGYRFDGEALQIKLNEVLSENKAIRAIVVSNPNNPLGTVINREEFASIFKVYLDYSKRTKQFYESSFTERTWLVFDLAYIETIFVSEKDHPCIITLLEEMYASKLYNFTTEELNYLRSSLIHIRSGTKGLSAAGERWSVIGCYNDKLMRLLIKQGLEMGRPPVSSQIFYAKTLSNYAKDESKLNPTKFNYASQVTYVQRYLAEFNLQLPDKSFYVQSSFYVPVNCSVILGHKILDCELLAKLRATKLPYSNDSCNNDEEIAYYLLIEHGIMLTPMSYLGMPPTEGLLRMTCSGGLTNNNYILKKLAKMLNDILKLSPKIMFEPITFNVPRPFTSNSLSMDESIPQLINNGPMQNFAQSHKRYWHNYTLKAQQAKDLNIQNYKIFKNECAHKIKDLGRQLKINENQWFEHLDKNEIIVNNYFTLQKTLLSYNAKVQNGNYFDYIDSKQFLNFISSIYDKVIDKLSLKPQIKLEQVMLDKALEMHQKFSLNNQLILNETEALNPLVKPLLNLQKDIIKAIQSDYIKNFELRKLAMEPEAVILNILLTTCLCIYHKPYSLINIVDHIKNLQASIDYSHPRGEQAYLKSISDTINLSYTNYSVSTENVLLTNCIPMYLIAKTLNVKSWHEEIQSGCGIIDSNLYYFNAHQFMLAQSNTIESAFDPMAVYIEQVELIKKYLLIHPKSRLIIDETCIEHLWPYSKELGDYSLLDHLLSDAEDVGELKNRVILIRSSKCVFSNPQDQVAIIVCTNKQINNDLLENNIQMSGHAPVSFQYSYAYCLNNLVNNWLLNPSSVNQELLNLRDFMCRNGHLNDLNMVHFSHIRVHATKLEPICEGSPNSYNQYSNAVNQETISNCPTTPLSSSKKKSMLNRFIESEDSIDTTYSNASSPVIRVNSEAVDLKIIKQTNSPSSNTSNSPDTIKLSFLSSPNKNSRSFSSNSGCSTGSESITHEHDNLNGPFNSIDSLAQFSRQPLNVASPTKNTSGPNSMTSSPIAGPYSPREFSHFDCIRKGDFSLTVPNQLTSHVSENTNLEAPKDSPKM